MYILKRTIEIIISISLLIILSPLILLISILIKTFSFKETILFKQKRVGKNGQLFIIYKFRTMNKNAEKDLIKILKSNKKLNDEYSKNHKLKNDPRVIKGIGTFLRKTSLDEIPQFINVIKGEMTFVGPRPFLESELKLFKQKEFKVLCSIKPGITGLWQVSGRNNLCLKKRVEIDLNYIKNKSLYNDFIILLKTIQILFLRNGAF